MQEIMESPRKRVSRKDVDSLVYCNKLLKDQLDHLRVKLDRAERLIEILVKMTEEEEEKQNSKEALIAKNTFSLN